MSTLIEIAQEVAKRLEEEEIVKDFIVILVDKDKPAENENNILAVTSITDPQKYINLVVSSAKAQAEAIDIIFSSKEAN